MAKVPKEVDARAARVTADTDGYKVCMSVIKARIFTIQRLLKNEILVPYEMLKLETVHLQFRLLLEMLYLSTISTRKRKYEAIWPRSEKEYQPSEIRKYLGDALEEHFPYPFQRVADGHGFAQIEFFDRPVSEEQVYRFFNKCHQYLHEPNPYKKDWLAREAECRVLLEDAATFLQQLSNLLGNHYRVTELDDGEKVGMICSLGAEKEQVVVQLLLSAGPKK
jgi:hypothetical protein